MMWDEWDAEALTPRQIVTQLDRYIIGQQKAKRAVGLALRNRWRRQQLGPELRDEVMPKNIIMIGPTGVGKSEIARRLARLARAPFLKVEASKFTEVGYVGRDVESMVRDLVDLSVAMVKEEAERRVEGRAREFAEDRVLELLGERVAPIEREPLEQTETTRQTFLVGSDGVAHRGDASSYADPDEMRRRRLRSGEFDDDVIEIEVEDPRKNPVIEIFSQPGHRRSVSDELDLSDVLGEMFPSPRKKRRVLVSEAMGQLIKQEAGRLVDMSQITREALRRAQQSGIIFLDEIDKIAGSDSGARTGPDISREGVQRDLLPIVEGSSVMTKHGVVKTDHMLFIAAGAFHLSRPSDLIPELQGRFPIRVELDSLTQADFERILTEPKNALVRQYSALLATEGVEVIFDRGAIAEIARMAWRVNENLENIGARRLHTILERVIEEISFEAPELERHAHVEITADYVRDRLEGILGDEDVSRYIL